MLSRYGVGIVFVLDAEGVITWRIVLMLLGTWMRGIVSGVYRAVVCNYLSEMV